MRILKITYKKDNTIFGMTPIHKHSNTYFPTLPGEYFYYEVIKMKKKEYKKIPNTAFKYRWNSKEEILEKIIE